MTLGEIRTFHNCCRTIIRIGRESSGSLMQYAVNNARAGLAMDNPDYIQSQIPYILSNLTHVRNNRIINETKAILKGLQNG